jgi:putative tricarboxylic transport membrane protein
MSCVPVRALALGLLLASHSATGAGGRVRAATAPVYDRLVVYGPATAGGGWDQTAQALKAALEAEGLARQVVIVYRPGAGGLVGLAEFLQVHRGDPHYLLFGGEVTVLAAKANRSSVMLSDATPIARLTSDYQAVAVPAGSALHSLADLKDVLRSRPGSLHWTGGASGGPDERLAEQIATAAGVDGEAIGYEAQAGAGDVASALQAGDNRLVGISTYGEMQPYAQAGRIRILAVAAPGQFFAGLPTLRAGGVDIVAANWRGLFAPPALAPADRRRLVETITAMSRSPVWRDALKGHQWRDIFLADNDFRSFLVAEEQEVARQPAAIAPAASAPWRDLAARYGWPALAAAAALAGLAAALLLQSRRAKRREAKLTAALAAIRSLHPAAETPAPQAVVVGAIRGEFDDWKLTNAEQDVAWLMLKGLPMKEIARLRGTSERTIRQQARSIYGKAQVEGRSDLAGHILDRCLAGDGAPG